VNATIRNVLFVATVLLVVVLVPEAICRLCGRPYGDFENFFQQSRDLYPAGQTLTMSWGPIPYVVKANSQGFRGEEFDGEKDPGTLRILTIGDSITDGLFVDNASTWQFALRTILEDRLARRVEVINGARGGGSIDKELAMLRRFVPRVDPDVVLLTFVSNDIAEILGVPRQRLLQQAMSNGEMTMRQRIQRFFIARSGLGEFLFHAYLTARSPAYRQRPKRHDLRFDEGRYAIAGALDYEANADLFRTRFATSDGLVLEEPFSEGTEAAFGNYGLLLGEFSSLCEAAGTELLFVYFPAYPQIYDETASRFINDRLRSACEERGIDFLDMTDGFRAEGRKRALHLAPLDYHLNPAGNAVFARIAADHLAGNTPLGERLARRFAREKE
jgi:lysophospholipase L1-like esterase